MSKLSIDLRIEKFSPIISKNTIMEVLTGCWQALENLGETGLMVEVFRVTFREYHDEKSRRFGPVVTVHFRDPLGIKFSYETFFQPMGAEGVVAMVTVPAQEISDRLGAELPKFLSEHLERAKGYLNTETKRLAELI